MRNLKVVIGLLILVVATSVGLAACGSDDDGDTSASSGGSGASGGEITISQSSQPDFLDPALSYTVNGWEPMWLVYTPLLTYKHVEGPEGAVVIPGLAEALPEVTNGDKTYTLTLRKGLKYSDGTPVKASDFEHTIKRVLNQESGGSFFFEGIKGASKYLSGGNAEADISGITTNDKTGEIKIDLIAPDATFSNVLATNFAGLVPGDTPFENLSNDPPPGVGPYALTESEPNRQFVMEKVPGFAALGIPDIPEGNLDKITTEIIPSFQKQAQDVIDGNLDYMQDPPPADLKADIIARFGPDGSEGQRYEEFTTVSTYYFFMNHQVAPFDDPLVRQAVNYGLDKPALAKLFAGELETGCAFLPPGMPGHSESLAFDDCPWGDPTQPPDIPKAQQLIKQAGAEGEKVTVWGNNEENTAAVTEAYADMLNEIGLDAEPKVVDGGIYFQTIGNAKTAAQTGFANWFQDFPHPLNFLFLVDGASIQPTNNQNFGNVDIPEVNTELEALRGETDLTAVTDRYEQVDQQLTEDAAIAPYGYRKLATFFSDRMDFENCSLVHPLYQNDYSSWCLKEGE